MNAHTATPRKVRRALLMLAGSASLFGVMAFTAKLASVRLGGAEVAMIRFVVSLIPVFAVPQYRRAALTFTRVDLLFYRGFFGGLAVLCYFVAIQHIAVGVATLLNYTAPVFSGLFAALFIGERLRARVIIPLAMAFGGLLLVVHAHAAPGELTGFGKWESIGAMSAILSGAAVTAIRVARRTESSWSVFASFSLFGFLACAPFGIYEWKQPTPREWALLIAVGVISIGAQLLMTSALRWVETVTAGVISQFAVVVSMILGALWLNEIPNALSLVGSALTIAGVIAVMAVTSRPTSSTFDEPPEQ